MKMSVSIPPLLLCLGLALGLLTACSDPKTPGKPAAASLAPELVYYGYPEDMPQPIFDAFTKEFGVKIRYLHLRLPRRV